jgi:UDP-glucose 4-epimerase
MNCVVFGGAGFIGSHLVDALVSRKHRVRVFDIPNIEKNNLEKSIGQIEILQGDFQNVKDVSDALEGMDVAINFVYSTLPDSSNKNPAYDVESNVIGNIVLLEKALEKGVGKMVFVSSGGAVYGIPEKVPVSEDHRTDPLCSYGITKLAVEKYLQLFKYLHGLDYTVLRLGNPYGERQRIMGVQGAVAVFLGKIWNDSPIEIWGDGSVARDFMYIKDTVEAFVRVVEGDAQSDIYNIGSGESCSINRLLDLMTEVTGKKPRIEYKPSRKFDVPEIALDIRRAENELGWKPETFLEEGLAKTWDWIVRTLG